MVLTGLPPLRDSVAGQKYHCSCFFRRRTGSNPIFTAGIVRSFFYINQQKKSVSVIQKECHGVPLMWLMLVAPETGMYLMNDLFSLEGTRNQQFLIAS